jgi:ligand-binding SRPBCC domain-containing protein
VKFRKSSRILAPASRVFAFHEAKDALAQLTPPWQTTEILKAPTSLAIGTEVVLRTRIGPFWQTIVAHHIDYEAGHMFADRMVKGPFASWTHRHVVEPDTDATCYLVDDIDYELPLGALGRIFGSGVARRELERLFAFRHEVTRAACEGL